MACSDLGVGNTHTAKKRGHHKLVSTIWMIIKKDLAAKIQRFFPIGSGKFIEKSSLKGFYAVNIFGTSFVSSGSRITWSKTVKSELSPSFFSGPVSTAVLETSAPVPERVGTAM